MFRRRKPETAEQYLALAQRAFEREHLDEAARLCQEAIRLDPGNAEAYDGLATSLAMQDRLDEAIAAWERATALAPEQPDVAYSLGVAYEQKGLVEKAAAQFRRVLELEPGDEDALEKLRALGASAEALNARGPGRSLGLTPEEQEAGERLARLRWGKEKAIAWVVIGLGGAAFILLRVFWETVEGFVRGRPARQSLDDLDRVFVGAVAAVVAGLIVAAVVPSLRLHWALLRVRQQGLNEAGVDAYADRADERLAREERRAERDEERRRDEQWAEESRRAKPWCLRELSGAHLVWWVACAGLGGWQLGLFALSEAAAIAMAFCAVLGGVLKVLIPVGLLYASWLESGTYRTAVRYYRWWGRSWLPVVLALLPAVLGYLAAVGSA